jgi:hypothetical protein
MKNYPLYCFELNCPTQPYPTLHYPVLHSAILYVQHIQTFFHTVNTFPEADSSLPRMFFKTAMDPVNINVGEETSVGEKIIGII